MQFANVIVDHRAGYGSLTYAIPASLLAHLAIGSVVLVPIGPARVPAVVDQFIRRLEPEIAAKLKPIHSIVYPGEHVPGYLLQAVHDLQRRYGLSLSEILFSLLPPIPKRRQSVEALPISTSSGYKPFEYVISAVSRPAAYAKIADQLATREQSLLILCPSASAVRALAQRLPPQGRNITVFPSGNSAKAQREYFLAARQPTEPTIFIGTRGALITPLQAIGGIIIDEPWLPGHKEERSPRLWTSFVAQSLCRARGIPLYLASSLPWPETKLIDSPKKYTVRSTFGKVRLIPRRNLDQTLTQFLAEYDGQGKRLAIFLREETRQLTWCIDCRYGEVNAEVCQRCGRAMTQLPKLDKAMVTMALDTHQPKSRVAIYNAEELIQYRQLDAALVMGYDVFLSITDFRADNYLATLLYLIGAQAKDTLFATSYLDEWTQLIKKDAAYFTTVEIAARQADQLPPFSLAVQLSSKQKDTLEKLLPLDWDAILQTGKIRRHFDGTYSLSLLVQRGNPLPAEWFKKSQLKVDILPSYIE